MVDRPAFRQSEIDARRKLVAVLRQMLQGELSYLEGAEVVRGLHSHVGGVSDHDPDFSPFSAIVSEFDHLPLERTRHLWNDKALERLESEIQDVENWASEYAQEACRNLLARFKVEAIDDMVEVLSDDMKTPTLQRPIGSYETWIDISKVPVLIEVLSTICDYEDDQWDKDAFRLLEDTDAVMDLWFEYALYGKATIHIKAAIDHMYAIENELDGVWVHIRLDYPDELHDQVVTAADIVQGWDIKAHPERLNSD